MNSAFTSVEARERFFFTCGSLTTMYSHGWELAPDIAQRPASRIFSIYSSGIGSDFSLRMLDRRRMMSYSSSQPGVVFAPICRLHRRNFLIAYALVAIQGCAC